MWFVFVFFFSSRSRHTRCALVTGVQTCALPILSFISYDVALPGSPGAPGKANRSERGVKVLERPRREDVDTAAWQPELLTGADGKTQIGRASCRERVCQDV